MGTNRTHLVLVPGFGGFDVLGEIEYYAGTTELLRDWSRKQSPERRPVLHYFDNFPTAGVKTRALFLQEFLAKRVARQHFREGDAVILVGHSTGGLDIRQLLCNLTGTGAELNGAQQTRVDGDVNTSVSLEHRELRKLIKKVVFLSVPQYGTNIADWLHAQQPWREAIVALLRMGVDAVDVPGIEGVDLWWARHITERVQLHAEQQCGFRVAISDVHLELAEREDKKNSLCAAKGRAAQADVNLWLSHADHDFLAINDLACAKARESDTGELEPTPARFTPEQRERELSGWDAWPGQWDAIDVRSYATLGRCPFDEAWVRQRQRRWGERAPATNPIKAVQGELRTLADSLTDIERIAKDEARIRGQSDLPYRLVYLLCSAGPFEAPPGTTIPAFGSNAQVPLESWQNDGIVNTASMRWPRGQTRLVAADHGDIIGHFKLGKATGPCAGRRYAKYDILESSSAAGGREFDQSAFQAVWEDLFEFAMTGL